MRLDRAVASAINESCWNQARFDLRWRIWEYAHAKYGWKKDVTPQWYKDFSLLVACQYLSGTWPPANWWYDR